MERSKYVIGIDIAKAKFDIALILNDKIKMKVFKNNPEGFKALISWLETHKVHHFHACMEATGVYGDALAEFLFDAGYDVSVVNPAQISAYSKSQLQRGKTDAQDARLIARFCEREHPMLWQPAPIEQRELMALMRQLQHLKECLQTEECRIQTAAPLVASQITESIAFIKAQIKTLSQQIDQHIDAHPTLKQNRELLNSIPGVGDKTTPWLLAYLGDGSRFTRSKQVAAFAGLCPSPWQSGSSVRGKSSISKKGHADLRRLLYMPAMGTVSHKRGFTAFIERLKAAGKRPMEIIVAVMRKMLTVAQAVLKSGLPFNEQLHVN